MSGPARIALAALAAGILAMGAVGNAAAATRQPVSTIHPATATTVEPFRANGCAENFSGSDQVCIDLEGGGLYVSTITDSELRGPGSFCGIPRVWANGNLLAYGTNTCASYNINYEFDLDIYLANNTKVCVTWSDSSEEPCETVHS